MNEGRDIADGISCDKFGDRPLWKKWRGIESIAWKSNTNI